MSKPGSKLYCRILDYIEEKYPILFDVVKTLCLEYLFTVRGKAGVTFLCPKNIDNLVNLANSGTQEGMIQAADTLSSLVIPIAVRSMEEFKMLAAQGLPNNLGLKVPIDEKKSSGSKTILTNGAELDYEKDFQSFKKDPLMFIYSLKGEIPPIDSAAKADMGLINKKRAENKEIKQKLKQEGKGMEHFGSFELTQEDSRKLRIGIVTFLEKKYLEQRQKKTIGRFSGLDNNSSQPSCLIDASIELAYYILKEHKPIFESIVCALISFSAADIYIMLQPFAKFTNAHDYYVPDSVVKNWVAWRKSNKATLSMRDEILAALQKCPSGEGKKETLKAIAEIRTSILTSGNKAQKVIDTYKNDSMNNTIAGKTGILPAALASKYSQSGFRKLCEDELRFMTVLTIETLDNNFEKEMYVNLLEFISEYQRESCNGDLPEFSIFKNSTEPQNVLKINIFVNSSLFLYLPTFKADNIVGKESSLYPKPGSYTPWAFHTMIKLKTDRILKHSPEKQTGPSDDMPAQIAQK